MPEPQTPKLASENPDELIALMLDSAYTQIAPGGSPLRRGFQIALDAVSEPPEVAGADAPRRPRAANGEELVELLLAAAVAKIGAGDAATLAGVEVALEGCLLFEGPSPADVLAARFAAATE